MDKGQTYSFFELFCIATGGVILFFVIAPLLSLYLNSTPTELREGLVDKTIQQSIWLTLWTSMLGTLSMSIFAIPFAYFLARKDFTGKGLLTGLIDIPIVIPHSAAGIALLGIYSRGGFIGSYFEKSGISFVGTAAGTSIAMAYVSLPFLINGARNGFEAVPERLENAAYTLGASPLRVFFTISLPLAWRAVLSGLILMWGRGMSEFGAVVVLAYQPMTAPVLIYERFTAFGLKYARPVTIIFIVICLLFFIFFRYLARDVRDARSQGYC
ncbi:ABC transporter permease [Candidatus Riflebacteria bacterium]